MQRRVVYSSRLLPLLFVAPQVAICLIFFYWPAGQAVQQSLYLEDPFGGFSEFVGFENFITLFKQREYVESFVRSMIYGTLVSVISLAVALLLAVATMRVARTSGRIYQTLILWPYAVAPAIAGVMWMYVFHPTIGILGKEMVIAGWGWNYILKGDQAFGLVVFAAAWKQISYNFIFFLAGLQAIPKSLIEAAAIDGAGPFKRFRDIVFPLLSPTGFFLLIVNIVYAFFETFGVIHAVTRGGPAKSTEILVYKVYHDGVVGLDIGGSAAQSVVLMVLVIGLTIVQFKYVERKVHY
jgi:sn-glycerol 3-phosphate transport system permease protein